MNIIYYLLLYLLYLSMETNTLTKINIFNLDYETSMDVLQKYEEILVSLSIPTNNDVNKNNR